MSTPLPPDLAVGFLADHAEAVPVVARWLFSEWGHLRPGSSVDEVAASLGSCLNRTRIPFQLVAVLDGRIVAVAMVKEHELRELYPDTPNWLGSVFVDPVHRGRGIATRLVERAAALAGDLGVLALHLQTEDLTGGLYARLGWEPTNTVHHQGSHRLIMRRQLAMSNPAASVHIVSYDSTWPELFDKERASLSGLLAPWLVGPIEHVGSTAVPDLDAKPIIDIMAAVRDLKSSRPAIAALSEFGYCYSPYREDVMHWFCKPSQAIRTHHLHLVPFHSQLWLDRLNFRDLLRANPRVAAEYATLKRRLATQYEFDREAYTDAKLPFVERVLGMVSSVGGRSV